MLSEGPEPFAFDYEFKLHKHDKYISDIAINITFNEDKTVVVAICIFF